MPDVGQYELAAFSGGMISWLERRGHSLHPTGSNYGNLQAIEWDYRKGVSAAADPRGAGEAWVGAVGVE